MYYIIVYIYIYIYIAMSIHFIYVYIYIYIYIYTYPYITHMEKIYKWEFSNFPHVYGCMRKRKEHDNEPPSVQEPIYSWEFSIYN